MADRYWVGGTANWDTTAGTKWATTSGGAGGASVPTNGDDVFFDAASGAVTVTTSGINVSCRNLNFTGFSGTIAGTSVFSIDGSVTAVAGMSWTSTGTLQFVGSGTQTLTSAGKTLGAITLNSTSTTLSLQDALTSSGAITVTNGTFTTNNYNVTATTLSSSNSNTRTINLGSSTVTLSSSTPLSFFTNTNLTFNAGTSTLVFNSTTVTVVGGQPLLTGATFYNVQFTNTNANTTNIQGINTFNNLDVVAPISAGVRQVTFDSSQTINGTLSTTGTAGNRRVWFRGLTYGIAQTLTINSAPSLTDADFRDIYVIGTAAPITGTRIGDLRGIRGITASSPKTVYWNLSGSQLWTATAWAATSGGAVSDNNFPLAQDTAVIDNTSAVSQITMDTPIPYTGSVNMSARTNALTLVLNIGQTIYGDWAFGSGVTINNNQTLTFSGRNTQTITSAGKTFSGGITIDSYGGTVQLADALNIGTNTLTVTNGTFDTKNFNVTAGTLSSSNSNVRTITLGSSTVTVSATPVTFTTSTNLTFNAGTSTINATSASSYNFNGGGVTFYNVTLNNGGSAISFIIGANTFNNLTITPPASNSIGIMNLSANQTITGTLTCAGATAVRRIFVCSDTLGTTRTLTVGTLSAQDCDFRDITIAGAAAGSSPTRAGDCGGNSGITFPAPKTVYWNLAGTQNWSATGWAPGSGGTPDINQFPLAQDTAVFDNTGSVTGTITINAAWNIGTFDASLRTSAMTLTTSNLTPFVYGDWKFGTGVTSASSTGTVTFSKRGTQTITSNGVQFGFPITVDCVTGTFQFADAFSSSQIITFNSGTLDAVTYNVTCTRFQTAGSVATKPLKMGSGLWTLTGTGSVWSVANFVLYKGTANILLSDTSTSARTFDSNNQSYNKLTIGGATGTSTLTISGNNQFTELASTKTVAHTIALGTTSQTFGKWTVTGTVGNVVTVTGTATITIAGACTSGLDYLALGTTTVSATSPGEFYAGANSTATGATAPLYLTAKPADSTRYWVGGTGNWSDTARWSTGSGGGSGASVPRSHDDVVFDSGSNATAYTATVNAVTGGIRMKSLTIAGPASGNVTLAGSTAMVGIHGNVTLPATGLTRTYTGAITLSGSATGRTFTTNGVALASSITINGVSCGWSLGSSLTTGTASTSFFTLTNGAFDTAGYTLTAGVFRDSGNNAASITLGSSNISLPSSNSAGWSITNASTVVDAGTSTISIGTGTTGTVEFTGAGNTYYNLTITTGSSCAVTGANTFNNVTVNGNTTAGIYPVSFNANQTINGTLTLSAGTNATMRTFVQSNTIGTTRTLTCAAFSGTDADFRDITIAGAAAPVSGTRLGDCKGNSGITFPAAKTVYWATVNATSNWGDSATPRWSNTNGGAASQIYFPLAQDTAVFPSTLPTSGATITINAAYNIGTIDMSARTSNTMTLATGTTTPTIYGNWINGTGTTLTGTNGITFAGRGSQTITNAGKSFTVQIAITTPGGSVTLQDAFSSSYTAGYALIVNSGTFDANNYNITTASGSTFGINFGSSATRTVNVGSGTWTIGASGTAFTATATNLTVTGTGTISLTSASAKTFAGGGISYSGITLDQGGAGTLTITGNNTFKDITNSYKATGATNITLGTTTQTVSQFTAAGEAGRVLTVQGTSASSPATLILTGATKPNVDYLTITGVRAYSLDTTWYAGANSTNNGSLGWYFEAAPVPATAGGNFFFMFYP